MEQINRVRPEASIMKILYPMTRHNVEVSEDTHRNSGRKGKRYLFVEKADGEEGQD